MLYSCRLTEHFPKEVLSNRKTYIDIDFESGGKSAENSGVKNKDSNEDAIARIMDHNEKLERAVVKLWDYLVNT